MSECRPLGIKYDGKIFWLFFFHEFEDHLGKTEYGICGETFGIGEISYGMVGTVDIGTAVNQVNGFSLLGHGYQPLMSGKLIKIREVMIG